MLVVVWSNIIFDIFSVSKYFVFSSSHRLRIELVLQLDRSFLRKHWGYCIKILSFIHLIVFTSIDQFPLIIISIVSKLNATIMMFVAVSLQLHYWYWKGFDAMVFYVFSFDRQKLMVAIYYVIFFRI